MVFLGIASQALLYVCYALMMASFIFPLIPANKKPALFVPKALKLAATAGIAFFSFIPILQLVLYLYKDIGLSQAFQSILFTFEVGKAWVYTFIISIILFLYSWLIDERKHKAFSIIGIGLVFLLILSLGWTSHASSLDPVKGFAIHTIHFTAVTVWVGLLLVVSWFSKNAANWLSFLKWFQITALVCFLITIATGLVLMAFVMEWKEYPDALMVSYGQSLLIKHLLIFPLIGYALINGVMMKKKVAKNAEFDPRPWTKLESVVILLIFAATGALSQASPPQNFASIINLEGLSPLFTLFYDGPVRANLAAELVFTTDSIALLVLAAVFLLLSIVSFLKKMPPFFSFLMTAFFVISGYLAFSWSITVA
jgi:putative copper export protein